MPKSSQLKVLFLAVFNMGCILLKLKEALSDLLSLPYGEILINYEDKKYPFKRNKLINENHNRHP